MLDILVKPTEVSEEWVVVEGLTYMGVSVHRGFVTDGASIPRWLKPIFRTGGKLFTPAVLHDLLYRTINKFSREEADKFFLEAMLFNKVPKKKAYWIYSGVRTFGWRAWNNNNRETI